MDTFLHVLLGIGIGFGISSLSAFVIMLLPVRLLETPGVPALLPAIPALLAPGSIIVGLLWGVIMGVVLDSGATGIAVGLTFHIVGIGLGPYLKDYLWRKSS